MTGKDVLYNVILAPLPLTRTTVKHIKWNPIKADIQLLAVLDGKSCKASHTVKVKMQAFPSKLQNEKVASHDVNM
jgi:hypothetical protein